MRPPKQESQGGVPVPNLLASASAGRLPARYHRLTAPPERAPRASTGSKTHN
jgi:hypothetical protein